MKKENKIKYVMNILFFLYFIVLIAERVLSLVLTFKNGVKIFDNGFDIYAYLTIFISFALFLGSLIVLNRNEMKSLFVVNDDNMEKLDFKKLAITSGLLLFSGMVHSHYTTPVIQFISYGFLIGAIVLQGVLLTKANNKAILWLSISYLIAFSMTIPVSYPSLMDTHTMFHIVEATAMVCLVIAFTFLTRELFLGNINLFNIIYFVIMVILDGLVIFLRWEEEINFFVLIFVIVSIIIFIIGQIIILKVKKSDAN